MLGDGCFGVLGREGGFFLVGGESAGADSTGRMMSGYLDGLWDWRGALSASASAVRMSTQKVSISSWVGGGGRGLKSKSLC